MFLRRSLFFLAAIALAVIWLNRLSPRALIEVGRPLGDVRAELSDGGVFRLDQQRGRITVLNFWASWCGPCRHEVPTLERLKHEGENVVALSIEEELTATAVGEKAHALGIDYPVGRPAPGLIERLRVNMVPTTCVIDGSGIVSMVRSGEVSYDELRAAIASAGRR